MVPRAPSWRVARKDRPQPLRPAKPAFGRNCPRREAGNVGVCQRPRFLIRVPKSSGSRTSAPHSSHST